MYVCVCVKIGKKIKAIKSSKTDEAKDTDPIILFRDTVLQREKRKKEAMEETAPTLFKNDKQKEIWKTEQAYWCVDMLEQWIYGGKWIEVKMGKSATLFSWELDEGAGRNANTNGKLGPKVQGLLLADTEILYRSPKKAILRHRWYEMEIMVRGLSSPKSMSKDISSTAVIFPPELF